MKEIGGYFELEHFIDNEYYKNLIALNSGRNALLYLMKARHIRKLYIPYFLCDSISNLLTSQNCDFEYYYIGSDFMPLLKIELELDEYIYIVNYYGQIQNDKINLLFKKYGQIIIDNTHAFFQKPIMEIDTIYNCRKFFGVPDGSYLSTNAILNETIETDISKDRMIHLLGRFEGLASEYYKNFQKIDDTFIGEPLKSMSKLTHNFLGAIDYDRVYKIRNENYSYYNSKLCNQNVLKLITPEGSFAFPFYMENGIEIRKRLAYNHIYIPTLWPNVICNNSEDSIEYQYAANILPLPCDQRYEKQDLDVVIEEIKRR